MRFYFLSAIILAVSSAASALWNESLSPWSASERDYSDWTQPQKLRPRESWERLAVKNTPPPDQLWLPSLIGSDMLWAYQHTVSGKTGSRCPFYPSCSRYSRIAVEHYGLSLGVLMTGDRLSRCHGHANDAGQYSVRHIDGEHLIWDPPSLDAWWKVNTP